MARPKKGKPPAFQFYPRDWFDFRVQRMSFAAQGAYIKLLCYMWTDSHDQCSIIDNNELVANALGTTVDQWILFRTEIQLESDPILEEKDGRLVSARLRDVAVKQRKHRRLQAIKGMQSGLARLNRRATEVQPECQPKGNSSSSSSSSLYIEREQPLKHRSAANEPEGFGDFWEAYPKKEGRKSCVQWWTKHSPDPALLATMLTKIAEAQQTKKWRDKNGKFIPMPATWLNQERWNDEFTSEGGSAARLFPTLKIDPISGKRRFEVAL